MKLSIKQKHNIAYKGYTGTVFYSELYGSYFGWVLNTEGLLYYEYESLDMLKYSFRKAVDEYLECKQYVQHGYTNTEYLFEQLTREKSYEELSDTEKALFDQSIHKYWDWNSVISTARKKANEAGQNYRYMRSIAEIHDSAFEFGYIVTSYHIAERLLSKGINIDVIKDVCGLTDNDLKSISFINK